MPWDIVRLPCGAMSTHSTRCPRSANATARFSVVVVLATPPFWLAKTMTFALFCCTLSTWVLRLIAGKPVRGVIRRCACPSFPYCPDGMGPVTHWDERELQHHELGPMSARWRTADGVKLGMSRIEV